VGIAPAIAAHGPFDPAQGNTEQQERDEIGDHESAAAVLADLAGKAQKITEADGAAGNGENNTQASSPIFTVLHTA